MQTFSDFCEWMGSQRRVADALGFSESTVSRLANAKMPLTPEVAKRCEEISHGLFRKEKMLWPDEILPAKTEAA